jgi:error-prone DNA polymerase
VNSRAESQDHDEHDRAITTPLPALSAPGEVVRDYRATGLSLKAHPLSFIRESLKARRILTAAEVRDERLCPHGRHAAVAGLVLFRQPQTAAL